jgi:hypothetical protein
MYFFSLAYVNSSRARARARLARAVSGLHRRFLPPPTSSRRRRSWSPPPPELYRLPAPAFLFLLHVRTRPRVSALPTQPCRLWSSPPTVARLLPSTAALGRRRRLPVAHARVGYFLFLSSRVACIPRCLRVSALLPVFAAGVDVEVGRRKEKMESSETAAVGV